MYTQVKLVEKRQQLPA